MAVITLKIVDGNGNVSIEGESKLSGHANELEAIAIRDLVFAPSSAGSAYISEIFVTRLRDKASPKLAEACSMGTNLKTVTVSLFKNVGTGKEVFLQYTLTDTFVSRIEHETLEDNGGAYLAHIGYSGEGGSSDRAALNAAGLTMNANRSYSRARAAPTPLYPQPIGASVTDKEVERLWLSAATVQWTYIPYADGVAGGKLEKGWDLQQSIAL